MSAREGGGPAFPQSLTVGPTGDFLSSLDCKEGGMTLRDYFAAKAMQGFASTLSGEAPVLYGRLAQDAYEMADAMLKAREIN